MKFQSSTTVFSRVIDGEWVIMKQDDPYCFRLNSTAGFLWENLQKPRTSEYLLKEMLKHFDIQEDKAKKDLDSFIKQGINDGFLIEKN